MNHLIRWLTAVCAASAILGAGPAGAAPATGMSAASPWVEPEKPLHSAPVFVDGRPLFRVIGTPSYPATKRADEIADRIIALAKDPSFDIKDLRTQVVENGIAILRGTKQILLVVDGDAQLEGIQVNLAATVFLNQIGDAVTAHREERTAAYLWRMGAAVLAATAALALLLWLTRWLQRRLVAWLKVRFQRRLEKLETRSFGMLDAEQVWAVFERTLWTFWWIVAIVASYAYVEFSLESFPWTRRAARWLLDLVVDPLRVMGRAVVESIPDLAFIAILMVIVRYFLAALRMFFVGIERRAIRISGFYPEWAMTTYKLVRFGVIAFAVVVAYPYIPGSSTDAFKGISVFVGVLVSLGASSIISNTLAGYTLIYRRVFQVGDRVLVGKHIGDVKEIRQQVTLLHTPKNEAVVIPNSFILASEIVNYSAQARQKKLILHSTVTIGYDAPWRQVEAMLLEAAARTEGLLKAPEPFVLKTALNDFYVNYEINAYCDDATRMPQLYSTLHQNILDAFNEHGVQIMSPHFRVQPDQPVLVPKDRWYEPPARRPDKGPEGV